MLGWRHRAIALGLGLIGATGLDKALRGIARGYGVILMLHSVRPARIAPFRPNAALEVTPEFLGETLDVLAAEGFEFVPLDAVPGRLSGDAGSPPFAAVTFDDGYRDNRDHALPVLRARGIPWTVFVTTEFAAGTGRVWWVELERAIERLDEIRISDPRGEIVLPARTPTQKARAFTTLHARARAAARPALIEEVDRVVDAARLDPHQILRELCMDWDELAHLSILPDVQIGAHAVTHHALARLDPDAARREILGGRRILEDHVGVPVRHLAYPYGDAGAAGPREFDLAREAGFQTAVTTRPGHLFARHVNALQALPRVSINGHFQNAVTVRALASGVPFIGTQPSSFRRNLGARRWQRSGDTTYLGPS